MERFNTSKEELQKLGSEFDSQAYNMIDELFNLSYWLVLNKRYAKKVVAETYNKAIYYCDKTKGISDWQTWIHRIYFNRVFDHYNKNISESELNPEQIDSWLAETSLIIKIKDIYSVQIGEKSIIKLLKKLPQILLLPLILKEIYNLSYQSIAEFLDVPDGVVTTRIFRARKLFLRLLAEIEIIENSAADRLSNNENDYTIFNLRDVASFSDNELSDNDKTVLQKNMNTDPLLKMEFQIQEQVKMLISKSVKKLYAPAGLKRKIKKVAEKRFSAKI